MIPFLPSWDCAPITAAAFLYLRGVPWKCGAADMRTPWGPASSALFLSPSQSLAHTGRSPSRSK